MNHRRYFNAAEKAALINLHGGHCALCANPLSPDDVHIDHVIPYSQGGPTTLDNAQPLCGPCNLAKWTGRGVTPSSFFRAAKPALHAPLSLRVWQGMCLHKQLRVLDDGGREFMVAAGVGGGTV